MDSAEHDDVPFRSDGGSWWLDDALRAEKNAPPAIRLTADSLADIVVVGGGYSGLWASLAVKQRDPSLDVVLLEAQVIGQSPSGMNGGFMNGYRSRETLFARSIGATGAREVVEAGEEAQQAIIDFLGADADEVWLSQTDVSMIATSWRQLAALEQRVENARRSNALEIPHLVSGDDLRARYSLSGIRGFLTTGNSATLHPARLVRLLRRRAIGAGVRIYEHSPVTAIEGRGPHVVRTAHGKVHTSRVIRATNFRGIETPEGRSRLTTFSSYAMATAPMPELLRESGWGLGRGGADVRMFLNYFQSTPDGRMVAGSAVGPIAYRGRAQPAISHRPTVRRLVRDFRAIFPEFAEVPIVGAWAGPIDMSSDQFPFVGRQAGTGIVYGYGLSGHGVNAAWIVGQVLASMALGADDRWSRSPFVARRSVRLPPEPFRFVGGTVIKRAVLRVEDALDADRRPALVDRALADLPRRLNMRIGTRD